MATVIPCSSIPSAATGPDSRPFVLLVDDEESNLVLMERVLRPHCRMIVAGDLGAAERLLAENPVGVVVCDHRLPDGLGLDFLGELHRRRPELVGVLITGYSEESLAIEAANSAGIFRYLKKPFGLTLLVQTVQDALHRHAREEELRLAKRSLERASAGDSVAVRSSTVLHVAGVLLLGAALLVGGLLVLGLLALMVVYVLKSGLGIDVFKDTHLGDFLFR